jgi:hypothetical protein
MKMRWKTWSKVKQNYARLLRRRPDIFYNNNNNNNNKSWLLGGDARAYTLHSGGYDLININANASPPFVQPFIVMLYEGPF